MNATRLWKALDRIRKPRRWIKEELAEIVNDKGEVGRCLVGAIMNTRSTNRNMDAVYVRVDNDPECELVMTIIQQEFPDRCGYFTQPGSGLPSHIIPKFNDHQDTTHDDVIRVLEKAAIQCDEVLG